MYYYLFENIYIPESMLHKLLVCYPGRIGDAPVMLAKPQTFMNASGESVSIMIQKKLWIIIVIFYTFFLDTLSYIGGAAGFILQDTT